MKNLLFAALTTLLLGHSYAQGDLYFGSFDENLGNLQGQDGWIQLGSDATNPIKVVVDPYDPDNQVVRLGGPNSGSTYSGQDLIRSFDGGTAAPCLPGGSIEVDFSLNLRKVQSGDYFLAFAPTSTSGTTSFFGKIFAKTDGQGRYLLGLSATGATATYGTTSLLLGDSPDSDGAYSLSLIWEFLGGVGQDRFTLSLDGVPEVTVLGDTATPSQLSAFTLRQGSLSGAPVALLDDIAIFYDVPEPTSLALCVLSAALFFAQSRRHRTSRK